MAVADVPPPGGGARFPARARGGSRCVGGVGVGGGGPGTLSL